MEKPQADTTCASPRYHHKRWSVILTDLNIMPTSNRLIVEFISIWSWEIMWEKEEEEKWFKRSYYTVGSSQNSYWATETRCLC